MRYKHFTNANVDVSALAVGTWAIGGQNYGAVDRSDSIKAIHAMLDPVSYTHLREAFYGNRRDQLHGDRPPCGIL